MQEYKVCNKCGENKNVSEFYVSKKNKAGKPIYKAVCKECLKNKPVEKINNKVNTEIATPPEISNKKEINIPEIDHKKVIKDNFLDIFDKDDLIKVMACKETG